MIGHIKDRISLNVSWMQWAGCSAVWPGLGWLRSTAAAGGGVGWNGRGVYGGCQLPAGRGGAGKGGEGTLAKIGRRERERRREPFAKTARSARMARSGSSSSREAVGGLLG